MCVPEFTDVEIDGNVRTAIRLLVERRPRPGRDGRPVTVDFHSHTLESDGTLSPAELVAKDARPRGLVFLHHRPRHDPRVRPARAPGQRVTPGIEINTTWDGSDVHVLGYRVPTVHHPRRRRSSAIAARRDRIDVIVGGLNRRAIPSPSIRSWRSRARARAAAARTSPRR